MARTAAYAVGWHGFGLQVRMLVQIDRASAFVSQNVWPGQGAWSTVKNVPLDNQAKFGCYT